MPTAISAAAAIGRVPRGPRLGRSPREREHDGEAGDRSPRPPGGGGRPEDCEEDGRRDQRPRKAEPVDAMVDRGLERRREGDPEREARDRPDECGDRPDERAVGQQHEADVLLRGADGGEHAELAEPSLRDDREAGGGDQRGQEQEDGGHGEHRQRVCRLPDRRCRVLEPAKAERAVPRPSPKKESSDASLASTRTVTWSGARGRRRRRERTRRSACAGSRRCRRRSVDGRRAPASTRSRAAGARPRRR